MITIQTVSDDPNQIGSADTEYIASECLLKSGARPVVHAIQTILAEKAAMIRQKTVNTPCRSLLDKGT